MLCSRRRNRVNTWLLISFVVSGFTSSGSFSAFRYCQGLVCSVRLLYIKEAIIFVVSSANGNNGYCFQMCWHVKFVGVSDYGLEAAAHNTKLIEQGQWIVWVKVINGVEFIWDSFGRFRDTLVGYWAVLVFTGRLHGILLRLWLLRCGYKGKLIVARSSGLIKIQCRIDSHNSLHLQHPG